jgi:two-component system sensor histidine kinase BarA
VESGIVEDILLAPLSRREVMDQIGRILDDKLRGKAALANTDAAKASHSTFKGQRVLAADDSAVNREVVQEALARLNLQFTLAGNGKEALALARDQEFDLILMDCSMPEMDGFEATIAIRAFEKLNGRVAAPIIALTAHVAGSDDTWHQAGMDDYLTKPFTLDTLATVIRKYLPCDDGEVRDGPEAIGEAAREQPLITAKPATAFDHDVLYQIAEMQPAGVNLPVRALTLFEQHSREELSTMAASLKNGDHQKLAKAAHALKSMSLNVGARALAAACSDIEQAAADGKDRRELITLCKVAADAFRQAHGALPATVQIFQKHAA